MKKLNGIAFILIFCFSLAFVNAGTSAIERTTISLSSAHPSNSLLNLPFSHPNSEIEIYNFQSITASNGTHGFQKILGYLVPGTRKINLYDAFSSSDNSLPAYFYVKEYLSHIYPFHSFW